LPLADRTDLERHGLRTRFAEARWRALSSNTLAAGNLLTATASAAIESAPRGE